MFSSTAPILSRSSPEGRGLRRMGRRLNDAFTSACQDENLKCSVNCCIVYLHIIHSTTMSKQDKITIIDSLTMTFPGSDTSMDGQKVHYLFALATRRLLYSSLLSQQDEHYEHSSTRNGQSQGSKPRTIRTTTDQITTAAASSQPQNPTA